MDTAVATARSEPAFSATLPGHYYYDPAIYEREQERIFSRMWVCVGRAGTLPNPGDYLTAEAGRENVIVMRGRDGLLRAFLNVCRHRGARLRTEVCGHLQGALQCRYHAWSYGFDGRLTGAPNVSALEAAGFDRNAYGLLPVALESWEGMIWLNLAPEPQPIGDQLHRPIIDRLGEYAQFARWGVADLDVAASITYDVRANWKLVVENFMECYHCATLHPELCRLLPGFRSGQPYLHVPGIGTRLADDVEAFTDTGRGGYARLPGLLPEDDRTYYGIVLRPNVFVNLLPDHVVVHTLWPQEPARTRVDCAWLFHPEAMARPDFDPAGAVNAFDLVNRQDWEVCELTQLGMTSRAYASGGLFVPAESHIRAFNDFVLSVVE